MKAKYIQRILRNVVVAGSLILGNRQEARSEEYNLGESLEEKIIEMSNLALRCPTFVMDLGDHSVYGLGYKDAITGQEYFFGFEDTSKPYGKVTLQDEIDYRFPGGNFTAILNHLVPRLSIVEEMKLRLALEIIKENLSAECTSFNSS